MWEQLRAEGRGPRVEAAETHVVSEHNAASPPSEEVKSLGVELTVSQAEDDVVVAGADALLDLELGDTLDGHPRRRLDVGGIRFDESVDVAVLSQLVEHAIRVVGDAGALRWQWRDHCDPRPCADRTAAFRDQLLVRTRHTFGDAPPRVPLVELARAQVLAEAVVGERPLEGCADRLGLYVARTAPRRPGTSSVSDEFRAAITGAPDAIASAIGRPKPS